MSATSSQNLGRSLLNRVGVDVRAGEGRIVALLFFTSFLVVTFQYVAKTVRQSTFIDSLGATNLPYVYLLTALCSYPLLRLYVRYADRMPRHRLMSASTGMVLVSILAFWWLYQFNFVWVPFLFYMWVSISFVTLVSQFWSLANHVFDPRQARRLFGIIGAGGLLGGAAGGQVARLATVAVGPQHVLLVAALILLANVFLIQLIHRLRPDLEEQTEGASGMDHLATTRGGFQAIRHSRHLQLIGFTLVLGLLVAQVVDLQFNWAVEQATTDLSQRTAYFGNFFSLLGVYAFLFQLLGTAPILRTLGVGFALRVLPVAMAVGTLALLISSGFFPEFIVGIALALKMGESGIRYSLDQSTRELLFLPVSADIRIKAKAFIDVFVQRSAKGLAALLLLPVAWGFFTPIQAGWVTLGLVFLWFTLTAASYRAYVQSFRTGLKQRTVDAAVPINLADVKTVELLVQSLGSSDPRQVLHSLEILENNGRGNLVQPLLLYHDDPEVRRRTLQILAGVGRKDAAPLIERRLGDENPDVRAEAIRVLTEFNAEDACELMMPRLKEADPRVRSAAITCLINHGDEATAQKGTEALVDLLSEASAEHRAEAVKAIGAIHGSRFDGQLVQALYDPSTRVAREAILSVRRIVARDGFNPLYVPRLISLLRDRRLKADAREALVAFGEDAVPILTYFLKDREESIYVRRSLPKTLGRIPGKSTLPALVEGLLDTEDGFVRGQLVEALATRREELQSEETIAQIEQSIQAESGRCLGCLSDIVALGEGKGIRFDGPLVKWDRRELDLLTQMLAERLDAHLRTLFGLVALLYSPPDVWAAHRSLTSGKPSLRAHALEFLDHTLTGEVRKNVFAVINDTSVDEKLRQASKIFDTPVFSKIDSVNRMLDGHGKGDGDTLALSVAGIYTIYTERIEALFPRVARMSRDSKDPLIRETAGWVADRLELTPPPLTESPPAAEATHEE